MRETDPATFEVVKNALYRTIGETSTALRLRPDAMIGTVACIVAARPMTAAIGWPLLQTAARCTCPRPALRSGTS
jgi:hypothetical protein